MVKVVIDTNVLVSSSIKKGFSFSVINICVENLQFIEICLSQPVLEEYNNLIFYDRLIRKYPNFIADLSTNIEKLEKTGVLYYPKKYFDILKDTDDNKFLNLAIEAKARYLITGNHKDFTITEFEQTKILNPKTFCDLYEQNKL
jgi:uncharacterized protein